MIEIRKGDRGPRVVLLQILLNRKAASPALDVDGIYGKKTQAVVEDFRQASGLAREGMVDGLVWKPPLVAGTKLRIVDSVDMAPESGNQGDFDELKEGGGDPIAQSRHIGKGVEDAIDRIIAKAEESGTIAILRFHGHGHQGQWWTVSIGDPLHTKDKDLKAYQALKADWPSYIDVAHVEKLLPTLRRLKPYFAKFGSVEHHGCKIGTNRRLLGILAEAWQVPVTGGINDQEGGGAGTTFVFEGSTYTAFPGYKNLKSWAKSVVD